ncbi:MAG TPA: AI-2E family transporter [Jatrophihabitans sp.]|uniref:AI-2E family transporter n=1 Tax=Jatrophihabitans sp. TaxID=1932789 RepID=UPI002F07A7E7
MSEPVEPANHLTAPPRRGFATYSPFRLGLTATVGFGLTYLLFRALDQSKDTLLLLALSLFLAAGLDPAVRRMENAGGIKRGMAVAIVFVGVLVFLIGMCVAVIPPLVEQTSTFTRNLPGYVSDLQHHRRIADLDRRFGLLASLQNRLQGSTVDQQVAGNLLSVGTTVAASIFKAFTLAILTLYFLAYLRDITAFVYRMTPASRRTQVSGIGDKIVAQIGAYVIGTVALALLRGTFTLVFLWAVGVPYPFALAFIAALLDLAPVVGTALAGVVVSTVVMLESVPTGIAVICFFIAYEVLARLVFFPRLLDRSVRISPASALVGALAGYTTLGVVGFLISIPLVAVITLIMREVVLPRQASR